MTGNHDESDDNFVMRDEGTSREEEDDREEFFEAPVSRVDFKSHAPIIAGAIGLVLIAMLVWLFLSGNRRPADSDMVQSLDSRLTQLEEKLAKLEWLDQGLARLDKQEKDFAALTQRIVQMEDAYKKELAQIGKNIKSLDKSQTAAKASTEAPAPPAEKKEVVAASRIHVIKTGETLYSISRKYGVSVDELRKLNKLSSESKIFPGQKLLLAP